MAQGRMVSRAVSEDEALNALSQEAHLFYLQALPHLDRDGLITGRPTLLWSKALPLRIEFMARAALLIDEWAAAGLVIRYAGRQGEPVLFFKGFRRHNQNIPYSHEAPSAHPPPPGWLRTGQGLIPEDPEDRRLLALSFDVRSQYRRVLEASDEAEQAFASRPRRQEEQDKEKARQADGGDVQTDHTHPVCDARGDARGEARGEAAAPGCDLPTLRNAAFQWGVLLFGHEWTDYAAFVAGLEQETLCDLLGWLQRFADMDERTLARIESIPAVIRSYLNRGVKPPLTTKQQRALRARVAQVQALVNSQWSMVNSQ